MPPQPSDLPPAPTPLPPEPSRPPLVQPRMTTHPFKSALALLALLLPLASTAATPEEETKFVDAAKKAFDAKLPAELSKLTCWDGVSEQDQKKQEETFKLLVEEKEIGRASCR